MVTDDRTPHPPPARRRERGDGRPSDGGRGRRGIEGRPPGSERHRLGGHGRRGDADRCRAGAAQHPAAAAGAEGPAAGRRGQPSGAGPLVPGPLLPRRPRRRRPRRGRRSPTPAGRHPELPSLQRVWTLDGIPTAAVDPRDGDRAGGRRAARRRPGDPVHVGQPGRSRRAPSTPTTARCTRWPPAWRPAASGPTTVCTSRCRSSGRAASAWDCSRPSLAGATLVTEAVPEPARDPRPARARAGDAVPRLARSGRRPRRRPPVRLGRPVEPPAREPAGRAASRPTAEPRVPGRSCSG